MRYVYQDTATKYDQDTQAMFTASERLCGEERERMIRRAHERMSMIDAGLMRVENICPSFQAKISEFCPELRVRYDFDKDNLVIEHFHPQTKWQIIGGGEWRKHDDGSLYSPEAMIHLLKAGDIQQKGTAKYLEEKRTAAVTAQKSNDHAHNQKVGKQIDKMSNRQVKQFIDVQNAIRTGEKVVPLGADAHFLDKANQQGKKEAASIGKSISKAVRNDRKAAMNPGQHPLIYKRDQK